MCRRVAAAALIAGLAACRTPGRVSAGRFSDDELKAMVEGLFRDGDPQRRSFHGLLKAGSQATPYLVKALDDPRTPTMTFKHLWNQFTGEDAPFFQICSLLASTAPAEAVGLLAPYVTLADSRFRGNAARLLANIGTTGALDPVRRALADPEREVRQHCMAGIVEGRRHKRQSDAFLAGAFEAIVPLLEDGEYEWSGPAAALAAIDAERAAPLLESPKYFTTRNPQLDDVLKGLNFEGHKTPHRILMPLLKELAVAARDDEDKSWEFVSALRLYARNPDADTEPTLRALIDGPDDDVASGAASALEILAGVHTGTVMEMGHDGKLATMTRPQRHYFAVREYHYEVCNGGHDQFFSNSSGDLYPAVLEGLRAIGAPQQVAIFNGALRAFASTVPSTDRTTRQAQMEEFPPLSRTILKTADERYFQVIRQPGTRTEVLLSLYAISHPADFGKQ